MEDKTSRALEAISSSDFELLIAQYLRITRPELSLLIRTGINQEGKPIPYPVDNLLLLPGTPPKCIAVQSTTYQLDGLKAKWLGSGSETGDLGKAATELQRMKQEYPDIECLVFLATNRPLAQETNLYRTTVKKAHALRVSVEILEQSALVAFLDFNQDGQYLRHQFLGIPLVRMGKEWLREAAFRSLRAFHTVTKGVLDTIEIPRNAAKELLQVTEKTDAHLIAVEGASGVGKSTLVRTAGDTLNTRDWLTVWMPAELAASSTTFEQALWESLRRYPPFLEAAAANEISGLISRLATGLTIIVDDINRTSSPETLLSRLESWSTTDSTLLSTRVRFIVPVWPGLLTQEQAKKWYVISVSAFSEQEQTTLATAYGDNLHTSMDLRVLIDMLNGDPFWCGLAISAIPPFSAPNVVDFLRISYERLMSVLAKQIASQGSMGYSTVDDLIGAIEEFAFHSIVADEPEPIWKHYIPVSAEAKQLMNLWNASRSVGWVEESFSGPGRWHWRHTRLRDMVLGRVLATQFEKKLKTGTPEEWEAWLCNPGLAEAWAISLAFVKNPSQQTTLIEILAAQVPLALIEVLRLGVLQSRQEPYHFLLSKVAEVLEENQDGSKQHVDNPLFYAALTKLNATRNPSVLGITETLRPTRLILSLRFRNGDLLAGIRWLKSELDHDFPPSVRFSFLEDAIQSYSDCEASRHETVAKAIYDIAVDGTYSDAGLVLAGYLGWVECASPLIEWWETIEKETKLAHLVAFIWMLSRCGSIIHQPVLRAALSLSSEIYDSHGSNDAGEKRRQDYSFIYPLEFSFSEWDITLASAKVWAEAMQTESDPSLRWSLCYIGRVIDHPETAEALIHFCAEQGSAFLGENTESLDPMSRNSAHRARIAASATTRTHLWTLITSDTDQETRKYALVYWLYNLQPDDIVLLQQIDHRDPLFERALRSRLRSGDETAFPMLLERIQNKETSWLYYRYLAAFIERRDAFDFFLTTLASIEKTSSGEDTVIRYLPYWGIDELINRNGDLLLRSPHAWQSLWKTDYSAALHFVQSAIRQASADDLKHFFHGGDGYPYVVSLQMLNAMLQVLQFFPPDELRWFADLALRGGHVGWVEQNLQDVVLADKDILRWETEEDIHARLDEISALVKQGKSKFDIGNESKSWHLLFSDYDRYGDNPIVVLRRWLEASSEEMRIVVAAMVMQNLGTGDDVDWWIKFKPTDKWSIEAWSRIAFLLQRRKWQQ